MSYDIIQPAGFWKNPLSINPFWERVSAEPPLEWTKWAAILEMAVFAKDGNDIRNLVRAKPPLVEQTEPISEVEIEGAKKESRRPKSRKTSGLRKPRF